MPWLSKVPSDQPALLLYGAKTVWLHDAFLHRNPEFSHALHVDEPGAMTTKKNTRCAGPQLRVPYFMAHHLSCMHLQVWPLWTPIGFSHMITTVQSAIQWRCVPSPPPPLSLSLCLSLSFPRRQADRGCGGEGGRASQAHHPPEA